MYLQIEEHENKKCSGESETKQRFIEQKMNTGKQRT
jgi:hypothetical protein